LGLSEAEAWKCCENMIQNAVTFGGVLTVLWHDRSPGPERFWGDFYSRLVAKLRSLPVCFASASQVVNWFGKRREVSFEQIELFDGTRQLKVSLNGQTIDPPLTLRVHRTGKASTDVHWTGESDMLLNQFDGTILTSPSNSHCAAPVPA